jgi:16S rRNA (guanine1207-N2)-methyltransferase
MNQYFNENKSLNRTLRYIDYELRGERFRFATRDGVFSKDHVDHATDILLHTIPPLHGRLADVGCGYGVIGIVLAKIYGLRLTAVDVNPAAVELTRFNCTLNGIAAEVIESDCFGGLSAADCRLSTVVVNPPIHAGKAVTYRMYEQSRDYLNPGGKLYVVTFKKHGAESTAAKLAELFGDCVVLYKKKGIYVFELTKL